MTDIRRFLLAGAATLFAVSALAACGDDSAPDGSAQDDTTSQTSAIAADDLEPVPSSGSATDGGPGSDEQAPADGDERVPADSGIGAQGDLASVSAEVTSPGAGIDLSLEVTAEQVAEADDPSAVWIVCAGVGAGGDYSGLYFVTMFDRTLADGMRNFLVQTDADVDGPGTYAGSLQYGIAGTFPVEVDGELTLDEGSLSGSFEGTDPEGNELTATYTCAET